MPDDPQLDALKLPPHSLEAEQSVLGGLLLDNEAADKIGDVITDDDFYSEAHRLIYRHIVAADRRRQARRRGHGCPKRWRRCRSSTTSAGSPTSGALVAERADRGEHPALRADRARALDPAPARGDGRRDRRLRVQPARPQREGGARRGRGQGAAHRRAGRARRAAVPGDRQAAGAASSSGSRRCTTATIRPTSPACRPASPISTR